MPASTRQRVDPKGRRGAAPVPVTLPGAWTVLVFACLLFSPSLVPDRASRKGWSAGSPPRSATAWALTARTSGALLRTGRRDPARKPVLAGVFVVGAVLLVLCWLLGQRWHGQLRDMMPAPPEPFWPTCCSRWRPCSCSCAGRDRPRAARRLPLAGPGPAVPVDLRAAGGPRDRLGGGDRPPCCWCPAVLLQDVLLNGSPTRLFAGRPATAPGVEQPTSTLRSGGPGSLVAWDTLGLEGRN